MSKIFDIYQVFYLAPQCPDCGYHWDEIRCDSVDELDIEIQKLIKNPPVCVDCEEYGGKNE